MKKLRLICCALFLIFLSSCSMFTQLPPTNTVRQAIIQQQSDMQKAVAEGLGLSTETDLIQDFKVGKILIEGREKLSDPALRKQAISNGAYIDSLYKVVGTYKATLTKGEQPTEENNPFEVYLGNRPKSMRSTVSAAEAKETWYLLSPTSAQPLP